jgi:AFG3 family protein
MSEKVGNISYYDSSGQGDFGFTKPYSEKTAELIDKEVKDIIEESYERAVMVLKDNIEGLTKLAELLLDKEVIFSEDLEIIFGKRKADIIKDAQAEAEAVLKPAAPAVEDKSEEMSILPAETKVKSKKKSESSNKLKEENKKPEKKAKTKD